MKKTFFSILLAIVANSLSAYEQPKIVATPPADAGRGLVRHNKTEIRHYSGTRKKQFYLVSKDNGETWKEEQAHTNYPPNFGGISKESPAIVQNPTTREYIRVQPIRGYIFISKGGLDGQWGAVTKNGTLDFEWKKNLAGDPNGSNYTKLAGILRNPTFVNKGKRIIIPTHSAHRGTSFYISDNGGLTWNKSSNSIKSPRHQIDSIDKGNRWQNSGVEASLIELKDKRLWAIVRTSQNEHYQSYSKDFGTTWSEAEPSRFFGTLTMPTLKKLEDGRIIASWTNTKALPEAVRSNSTWMKKNGYKPKGGEDAFTNRDSHHLAISEDDGKTWIGFREIILDEFRNHEQYATLNGRNDRGKHQSEILELDNNKILITVGQHQNHRKIMIIDLDFLYEKERQTDFIKNSDDWTVHSYIPTIKGHCSYNRIAGSEVVKYKGIQALQIRRRADKRLINEKYMINYEKSGATWNFPNGREGHLSISFMLDKNFGGSRISLTDRLFNACDETTGQFSTFSISLEEFSKLAGIKLKPQKAYTMLFRWTKADSSKATCTTYLKDIKHKAVTLKAVNPSPNGISYLHIISEATKEDGGLYLKSARTKVK